MRPVNFLRYPGGKSKVLKFICPKIYNYLSTKDTYCEPFVGGGSVALAVAKQNPSVSIVLNDLDPRVAAVWTIIANGNVEQLIKRLRGLTPSVKLFRAFQHKKERSLLDKAVQFIALNRMSFSGKTHTSPIGGWNQKGKWKVDAEWRIDHIEKNIRQAALILRGRTTVTSVDFRASLDRRAVFYVDPPYYLKGKNMYPIFLSPEDHLDLSMLLKDKSAWVLSYDDCAEIRGMYNWADIGKLTWTYSAGQNPTAGNELLIGPKSDDNT